MPLGILVEFQEMFYDFFLVLYYITFGVCIFSESSSRKNLYCHRLRSEDDNGTYFSVLCNLSEFLCERLGLTSWKFSIISLHIWSPSSWFSARLAWRSYKYVPHLSLMWKVIMDRSHSKHGLRRAAWRWPFGEEQMEEGQDRMAMSLRRGLSLFLLWDPSIKKQRAGNWCWSSYPCILGAGVVKIF